QFDLAGDPQGGKITSYLLEKSRVVERIPDERSFHIFYFMLAGCDPKLKQELGLQSPDYFSYLAQSGCYKVDGINDIEEWNEVVHAMSVMNIGDAERAEVCRVL